MTTVKGLFAGKIQTFEPGGERTGIYKSLVEQAEISPLGLSGDAQADKRYHGGVDKAVHQFSARAYEVINLNFPALNQQTLPGSFGENLFTESMSDLDVFIGDVYRINDVVLQVSEPRRPCWKINSRFNQHGLSQFVEQQCVTGWYYRVIESGTIKLGDTVELEERFGDGVSVARFTRTVTQHRPALDELSVILACRGLSLAWQKRLADRLQFLSTKK
jgi:MOSC domain-containing protein YiiM